MSFDYEYDLPPELTRGPEDAFRLAEWMKNELEKIQESIAGTKFVRFDVYNAEPEKLFDGLTVYADGTNFDPDTLGLGEGVYAFYNAGWHKLG